MHNQGEVFDVVDEEDNIVGRAERSKVHSRGLIHRSVFFFVFNENKEILVNKRSKTKEFYPGYYSIALGGHLNSGESYESAVIREAEEELGIRKAKPVFIKFFRRRKEEKDRENVKLYAFFINSNKKLKIDKSEISKAFFASLEEVEKLMKKEEFIPDTAFLYEIAEEFLKNYNLHA